MSARQTLTDLEREQLAAYSRGGLLGAEKTRTERLLEQSGAARAVFEEFTAGTFPKIPNYTILEQIGKGGFGVVYKAVHHAKERIEAVKVLFGRTPLMTSYFENEVHAIANLRHAHIATLFDAQLSTPPLYYTMEYVEGARLNEYVRSGEVSLARRVEIIAAVAEAIGYAHGQGVVHRDLKPQNILIDAAGQPHIVDFGIAKRLGLAERLAEGGEGEAKPAAPREGAIGTIGYISPEQVAGRPLDARADVYSLGALLFNCVTGEPARMARDPVYVRQVLQERGVSRAPDLAAIVTRCLQERPEDRYESCVALVNDLNHYLSGQVVRAHRTANPLHHARRVAAYVLVNRPAGVYISLLAAAATLMTAIGGRMALPADAAAAGNGVAPGFRPAALILFTTATLKAIEEKSIGADLPGLDPNNRPSLRLLHGALLRQLSQAEPRVIAWDYQFPSAAPEFDPAFASGSQIVQAAKTPVVVGAARFDVNSEPQMSPAIRAAVHSVGTLQGVGLRQLNDTYDALLCVSRGEDEAPIPSLAVAAYAAARRPDCEARLRVDRTARKVQIRYRLKNPPPEQVRWQASDELDYISESNETGLRALSLSGDRVAIGRVPAADPNDWAQRTHSYEDVLRAPRATLRNWFNGRAVIIGEAVPGNHDEYTGPDGRQIFGCQVQAQILDALLGHTTQEPLSRLPIIARTIGYCALGALAVVALPKRRWKRAGLLLALAIGAAIAGALLGELTLISFAARGWLEFGFGAACILLTSGLTAAVRIMRDDLLLRMPAAITPAIDDSTVPTTMVADTQ